MAMSDELANIFAQCEATKASDVHLACGEIPRFRMQGQLMPHPAFRRMDAEQVDAIAMELGVETLPIGCPDGTERVRTAPSTSPRQPILTMPFATPELHAKPRL